MARMWASIRPFGIGHVDFGGRLAVSFPMVAVEIEGWSKAGATGRRDVGESAKGAPNTEKASSRWIRRSCGCR